MSKAIEQAELLKLSASEVKEKYPGGVYIADPLSEVEFDDSASDMLFDESLRLSPAEFKEIEDYEIVLDGRLQWGQEELERIEKSEDQNLLHSMYYVNLKSRVEELLKLKSKLIASGWDFDEV